MLWSDSNLDQEVLLRVLMEGRDGSLGTKPGVNGDLFFVPVAQATVVGDADVPLQLRDLWVSEQTWEAQSRPGDTRAQESTGQTHTAWFGANTPVSTFHGTGT